MTSDPNAIVLAPEGVGGALTALIDRLQAGGIHIDVTDEVGYAAQLASRTPFAPPCVLVDLRGLVTGADHEELVAASERLRRVAHAMPLVQPIAITGQADAGIVVACLRAGAADVIDMHLKAPRPRGS